MNNQNQNSEPTPIVMPVKPLVSPDTLGSLAVEDWEFGTYELLTEGIQGLVAGSGNESIAQEIDMDTRVGAVALIGARESSHGEEKATDQEQHERQTRYGVYATSSFEVAGNRARQVRTHLKELDEQQKDILDGYLNTAATPFFRNVKEQNDLITNGTWADWLSDYADDEHFMNFLQWHVDLISQQQTDPKFMERVAELKNDYKAHIARGIQEGWLSEKAESAIDKVDDISVYVGDIFDTLVQGRSGYHIYDSDEIVIQQGGGESPDERRESVIKNADYTTIHELNHAVLGTEHIDTVVTSHLMTERWINEALTEHIAEAFIDGSPEVVTPGQRQKYDATYDAERSLLAALLNQGGSVVDASFATRAYSGNARDRAAFYDALNNSWGISVLGAVNTHIRNLEEYNAAHMQTPRNEITEFRIAEVSVRTALSDLLQQPEVIFGKGYKKPK